MRSRHTLKKLNQAGDTIVEVLIVLAILGLAMGVSYATANRSLLNVRQAEENTAATTIVQTQIELLRTFAQYGINQQSKDIFAQSSLGFCIDPTSNQIVDLGTAYPTNFGAYTASDAPCIMQNGLYYVADSYNAGTQEFTVEVAWYDVMGQGKDTVTMFYNLYPLGGG